MLAQLFNNFASPNTRNGKQLANNNPSDQANSRTVSSLEEEDCLQFKANTLAQNNYLTNNEDFNFV